MRSLGLLLIQAGFHGLQVKAARMLVESSECGMLKGKEMGVLSKHGLGHKRLDTLKLAGP